MPNDNDRIFFCNISDLKPKKKSITQWCGEKLDGAIRFWNNNKEFVIFVGLPVITGVIGLGKTAIRTAGRNHTIRKEDRSKRRRFYDPSLHCYWTLNHELSNDERVMISVRRRNGERYADIFKDMRLI